MNAIERKVVEKRLELLSSKLGEMLSGKFSHDELTEELGKTQAELNDLDGIINKKPDSEKTPAEIQAEYLMKRYGTTDTEKIKAIEKPSDDLLESILAPEGGNPNSAGTMSKRW